MIESQLQYTGTGHGDASIAQGHTNMHIEFLEDGKVIDNLQIDTGTTLEFYWKETLKRAPHEIKNFYISHCHSDHVGALDWFGLFGYFYRGCSEETRPKLFASERMISDIWDCIKGQCKTLEGKIGKLDTFFDVVPIEANGSFSLHGYHFQLIQTQHIQDGYEFMPSYGLMIQKQSDDPQKVYKKTFITTDTQFCPSQYMLKLYAEADEIHHDCEVSERLSGVHASFEDLCTLDIDIKKKLTLNHYKSIPKGWEKHGFKGFAEKGKIYTL
jgi:ribonuclease BN (tRNA processing enzyme)